MNPQQNQNQFAMLTVFGNQAVVDYLKNLLSKQTDISHGNAEYHFAAFNSLSVSQNMNAQIESLRNQFKAEIEQARPSMPTEKETIQ